MKHKLPNQQPRATQRTQQNVIHMKSLVKLQLHLSFELMPKSTYTHTSENLTYPTLLNLKGLKYI